MKLLNGFVYWPDIIQIGLLAAILSALVMNRKPTGEVSQEAIDKLDKAIKQIQSIIKH